MPQAACCDDSGARARPLWNRSRAEPVRLGVRHEARPRPTHLARVPRLWCIQPRNASGNDRLAPTEVPVRVRWPATVSSPTGSLLEANGSPRPEAAQSQRSTSSPESLASGRARTLPFPRRAAAKANTTRAFGRGSPGALRRLDDCGRYGASANRAMRYEQPDEVASVFPGKLGAFHT